MRHKFTKIADYIKCSKINSLFVCMIFAFSIPKCTFSQTDVTLGIYEWSSSVIMHGCKQNGTLLEPAYDIENQVKQTFTVLNIDGDWCVIKIIDYVISNPKNSSKIELYNTSLSSDSFIQKKDKPGEITTITSNQRYFKVKTNDIKNGARKIYNKDVQFTVGAITIPVKLRIQNPFDFSGNFSIAAAGGPKFRISKYSANYFDLLVGVGLSNISVDSASRRNSSTKLLPKADLSALTLSLGGVFEFGKAQAGLIFGIDWLSNSTQQVYDWRYHGKPWIGIGFGLSIFGTDQKQQSASNVSNNSPAK